MEDGKVRNADGRSAGDDEVGSAGCARIAPVRLALAGALAMAAAMGIGRFVYTPILPGMMESLGLSAADAGLIASANYLGYLVGALAAAGGWAEGRERLAMLSGLVASAALSAAMAAFSVLAAFLLVRFLAGVASAFAMVFTSTIVFSHLAAAGRPALQALHFGGVGAGIAASAIVTGTVHWMAAGWRASWIVSALLGACAVAVVAAVIDRGPETAAGAEGREPPLPRDPRLRRLILAYGLFGMGYIVTATFLVAIVRLGEGGRLFESVVWLATGLAGLPSVWFWAPVAARLGLVAMFALACLTEAAGVIASVVLGGHAGPLIGGILLGGTFIAITSAGLQAGRLLAGRSPRRVFALMTASFGLGQIIGPVAAGYAADWSGGFLLPSLGAAGVLLLAAALALTAKAQPR
jgi:predicted MFS family arabinose efflux permease